MASRITTVTLVSGTEQEISFDAKYSYFFIRNDSNSTAYVSLTSGISAGADGVISIPVGDSVCTTHGYPADKLYLLGDGSVHICGREHEINPFKTGSKGGGSGAVDSVNGKTGVVVLNAADVGAATSTDIENAINAVSVGNVNLFKNSGFNGTTGWSTYGAPTVAVNDGVISVTVTDAGIQWISPIDISMFKHGVTYTIRAWLKADMPIKMRIGAAWGNKVVDVTTEWALYTYTYTTYTTDGDNYIRPVFGTNAPFNNTTYYVKQPKLVEGNKITTDWSPNPDDYKPVTLSSVTAAGAQTVTIANYAAFSQLQLIAEIETGGGVGNAEISIEGGKTYRVIATSGTAITGSVDVVTTVSDTSLSVAYSGAGKYKILGVY